MWEVGGGGEKPIELSSRVRRLNPVQNLFALKLSCKHKHEKKMAAAACVSQIYFSLSFAFILVQDLGQTLFLALYFIERDKYKYKLYLIGRYIYIGRKILRLWSDQHFR